MASVPPTLAPGTVSSSTSRWPSLPTTACSSASRTPAWVSTIRSPAWWSSTWSIAARSTSTSAELGGMPHDILVPRPRGTTVRPCAAAARSTSETCCVEVGRATRPGTTRRRGRPHRRRGRPRRQRRRPRGRRRRSGRAWLLRTPPPGRLPAAGGRPCDGRGPPRTAAGVGKTLPGLEMLSGSKAQRTICMVSRSSSSYMRGMYFALSTPTPCSPVMEPPCSMHRSRIAPLTRSAASPSPSFDSSKSTSGCRLPSPAWKTLATRTPERARQVGDGPQHLGQRGARDDAVLHDVVGADPADRRERGLAALPDQRPVGGVGGEPLLERAVLARTAARPRRTPARPRPPHRRARSTSTAPAPSRVAAPHGLLGRLDRQRVHHLDGRRQRCRPR